MEDQNHSSQQELMVIHATLFRMGTTSLAKAYRTLGYKVHHGVDDVRGNPWSLIEKAAEATWPSIPGATKRQPYTRKDWDSLWGSKYDIVTDLASPFVHQLIKAYPNAKVVIVQRDFDSWWPSFRSQLLTTLFSSPLVGIGLFLDWQINGVRAGYAMRKVHFGFFGAKNIAEIEMKARETYNRYFETLRQMVPPERRLEYSMGDGWEPLCAFLGKDVPDIPFPRLNVRRHSKGRAARRNERIKVGFWALALLGIIVAIWFIRS
ncbi:hypothetical protein F5B22DRAFT_626996 [Xylaria bambusicola]|uniref:uncharacterized protein n=1 Tax=Xylaria bambusicola TaxID=326684 RepID=UPI0020083C6D|nr:uncharacterized protein F5B22DRAFT_626996 [Xylaria bambusicola]KAI0505577.1 hypothetical protein F5B22DRAFT_626996 [Xylaria bambusicola]